MKSLHTMCLTIGLLIAPGYMGQARAQNAAEPDNKAMPAPSLEGMDDLQDASSGAPDSVMQEMEQLEEGDLKEFSVSTDENISTLAVGDIYKSQQTYFKAVKTKPKKNGGSFVMQRMRGNGDPGARWSRISGEGPLTIESRKTLMDSYLAGGWCMHLISLCLLLTLIVSVRCAMHFRIKNHCDKTQLDAYTDAIRKGDFEKFEELAVNNKGLLAQIARVISIYVKKLTVDEIKTHVEAAAIQEVSRMQFPLRMLNFVTVASPLFGLLGTVTGMIACFDSLALEGASESKAVLMAAGIKQALYTTAYGLMVALPTLGVYFIFNHKVNEIANQCAVMSEDLVHEIAVLLRESRTESN